MARPWLSLIPSFASGGSVPELVARGLLHPDVSASSASSVHQRIPPAAHHLPPPSGRRHRGGGHRRVVCAHHGTGSGKSLAYHRPDRRPGPARARSRPRTSWPQRVDRLPDERACEQPDASSSRSSCTTATPPAAHPCGFARYTGQESDDERKRILADPPDILLTNYVMLTWCSPAPGAPVAHARRRRSALPGAR